MPFIAALVGILSNLGVRIDRGLPTLLKAGTGITGTRTTNGGLDIVTLDVTGAGVGSVETSDDTLLQRGPEGEAKAAHIELDANGPVADDGEVRLPEGGSVIGRVATGGGANALLVGLSGTVLLHGDYRTTARIRTAVNVEFQHGVSNTAFAQFVSGAPSQALDFGVAADGLCWFESSRVVKAARRHVTVTSVASSVTAYDGLTLNVSSGGGSNNVVLPSVSAGETCEVVVVTDGTGAVTIATDGADVFRVNGLTGYTQLDTLALMYKHLGNDTWGILEYS